MRKQHVLGVGLLVAVLCALDSSAYAEVSPLENVGAVEQSAESQNGETSMRTITEHQINECNQAIRVTADAPDATYGNASHIYEVEFDRADVDRSDPSAPKVVRTLVQFQRGPIKEAGTNGLTHEVLLAILIDRLRGFQSGPFSCRENALALTKLEEAKHWLEARTKARVARGVEGTNVV